MYHDLHGGGHRQLGCVTRIRFLDEDRSHRRCGAGFNTNKERTKN